MYAACPPLMPCCRSPSERMYKSVRPLNSTFANPSLIPNISSKARFIPRPPAPPVLSSVLSISNSTRRVNGEPGALRVRLDGLALGRHAGLNPGVRTALEVVKPRKAGGRRHLARQSAALADSTDENQVLVPG